MANRRRKRSYMKVPRKILWFLAVLAIFAAGLLAYKYYSNDPVNDTLTESQKAEAKADAEAKKQLVEKGNESSNGSNISDPPSDSGPVITSLTAKQESNGSVTVFTRLLSGTDGKCELTIKNGAQTANRTADIIYQPEFSTCAGFSLPISSVGYGSWSITLSAGGSTKTIPLEVSR